MAVRREAVRLEVEDHFTRGMLQAAAAAETLDRSLNSLSGSAVTSSRSVSKTERDVDGLGKTSTKASAGVGRVRSEVDGLGRSAQRSGASINQLSGRMAILARVAATLGPALVPIAAVGVAGVAGLASQLGFATIGALSLVAAVQGVGDALKAVEKARLDPTVANLEAAEEAMARLVPEAQAFVTRFQELRPVLGGLRDAAAQGWFPGLTDSLDSLETAAPKIERILLAVGTAGGDLIAKGAESLAGDRWTEFFDFIEAEAPDAITALGQAVGSLTHGLASLWMALDPVNDGVRDWLVDVTAKFDKWASSLDEGDVQGFFDYLSQTGPKVAAAAGAIANAILQIAEAAAPIGGPVLDALTSVANAIAIIADSPLGTPIMAGVAAMSALSLASNVATAALARFKAMQATIGVGGVAGAGKPGAPTPVTGGVLGLGLAGFTSGLTNGITQLNALTSGDQGIGETLLKLAPGVRELNILSEQFGVTIPGLTKKTDQLSDSTGLAAKAYQTIQASMEDAAQSTERAAAKQDYLRSKLVAARDAARESGRAFLDFSDSIAGDKFSMSGWLDSFEDQVKALTEFRDNLQTLRGRGLDASVVTELEKQGPAAAQAVAGLAKGGADNIERLNRAARSAGREIRGMGKDAKDAEKNIQDLGNKTAKPKVGLDAKGFENKRAAVDADLDRTGNKTAKPKADLNSKPFKSGIQAVKSELTGATRLGAKPKVSLSGVPGVESQLANLTRTRTVTIATRIAGSAIGRLQGFFADGGYTGDGGKYEPAGIVHRGEVVLPREIVKRDWPMLSSRYGHLPGFAGGGLVGDPWWQPATTASSNRGRGNGDPWWLPAGMEQLRIELPKTLKGLNRALKASEKALDKEKAARDAVVDKMNSLRDAVAGKVTSDLFGETDVWTRGGSIADGNARLDGDIARGNRLNANIAMLKAKGLTGPALDALLANADDETIANYAAGSRAELAGYRTRYEQRAAVASTAGNAAANAAYGRDKAAADARVKRIETRFDRIEKHLDRIEKTTRDENRRNREDRQRGNSQGNRGRGGK